MPIETDRCKQLKLTILAFSPPGVTKTTVPEFATDIQIESIIVISTIFKQKCYQKKIETNGNELKS